MSYLTFGPRVPRSLSRVAFSMALLGVFTTLRLSALQPGNNSGIGHKSAPASQRGRGVNNSITTQGGVEINQRTMDLMHVTELTPKVNLGGGIAYQLTTRLNSNLFSLVGPKETNPVYFVPTRFSPLGISREGSWGVI